MPPFGEFSLEILQIQRAIRRDPKAPQFTGLEVYTEHAADSTGVLRATRFEKFVADRNKDDANVAKQNRLAREEEEQRTKTSGQKGKKGKKDKEEE